MKSCKAKLSDGKPCPNQVDDGQEYCFFHLADQVSKIKKGFSIGAGVVTVFGVAVAGIHKVAKFVASKKL